VLGRLDPARLLSVREPVPVERVREAFAREIGAPLGLSAEQAAEAVIRLANVHMTGAIRMVSLSRGHDPRRFCLFAFGGAGPLHAVALAREIGIPEVLVPARPGLTNALGCLVADLRQDVVNTLNRGLDDIAEGEVAATLATQRARAVAVVGAEHGEVEEVVVLHSADMQFRGQTHLIRVALPRPGMTRAEIQAAFEAAYFARFQVRLPEIRAVLVNLNTSVIGRRRPFPLAALLDRGRAAWPRRGWASATFTPTARGTARRCGSANACRRRAHRRPRHHPPGGRDDGAGAGVGGGGGRDRQPSHQGAGVMDALTLAVIQAGLQQVCNEMDIAFSRAAFSPVIAEADDRSDGIYGAEDGALIAQGELGLPVFVGTMAHSAAHLARLIREGAVAPPEPGRHLHRERPVSRRHAPDGCALRQPFFVVGRCSAGCRTPATGPTSAAWCPAASPPTRRRWSRRGCACRP
jgi:hypothetical protein